MSYENETHDLKSKHQFARRLRQFRQERGLTMKEIAARLDVSVATYREWEYGRSIQDADRYVALAKVLGIGLTRLLGGGSISHQNIREQIDQLEAGLRRLKEDLSQILDEV